MVSIKVYAKTFYSYKEVDLETANEIKEYVNNFKFKIPDLDINSKNPLNAKIITNLEHIEIIKEFFNNKPLVDKERIIKSIEDDLLDIKSKNKLKDYIKVFPDYSIIIETMLNDYFDTFDDPEEYQTVDNYDARNFTDSLIGILILVHLDSISTDICSIIASYLDTGCFPYALYQKHPKLFKPKQKLIF